MKCKLAAILDLTDLYLTMLSIVRTISCPGTCT